MKSTKCPLTSAAIPSAALMEVLDPELNHAFPPIIISTYRIRSSSKVMFVCTRQRFCTPSRRPAAGPAWKSCVCPATTEQEKLENRQSAFLVSARRAAKPPGPHRQKSHFDRRRLASTSFAITRMKPACAASNANSKISRARMAPPKSVTEGVRS